MKFINKFFIILFVIVIVFNIFMVSRQKYYFSRYETIDLKYEYLKTIINANIIKPWDYLNEYNYLNDGSQLHLFIPNNSCGMCINNLLKLLDNNKLNFETVVILEEHSYFNHLLKSNYFDIKLVNEKDWPVRNYNVPFLLLKRKNDCKAYFLPYDDDYKDITVLFLKSIEPS